MKITKLILNLIIMMAISIFLANCDAVDDLKKKVTDTVAGEKAPAGYCQNTDYQITLGGNPTGITACAEVSEDVGNLDSTQAGASLSSACTLFGLGSVVDDKDCPALENVAAVCSYDIPTTELTVDVYFMAQTQAEADATFKDAVALVADPVCTTLTGTFTKK